MSMCIKVRSSRANASDPVQSRGLLELHLISIYLRTGFKNPEWCVCAWKSILQQVEDYLFVVDDSWM